MGLGFNIFADPIQEICEDVSQVIVTLSNKSSLLTAQSVFNVEFFATWTFGGQVSDRLIVTYTQGIGKLTFV